MYYPFYTAIFPGPFDRNVKKISRIGDVCVLLGSAVNLF